MVLLFSFWGCVCVNDKFFGEELHCMTVWLSSFLTSTTEVFAPEVAVWAPFVGSAQNELGFHKIKFI